MSIYTKLLEIQKQVTKLNKDDRAGAGSYGYSFVSGSNILEKIKPIMNEQGLLLKQEVIDIFTERIDYNTKSGSKSEMLYKGKLKFTWIDTETAEKDENIFFAAGMNDWEKGAGSLLTYGERYFLLKYFHIATDEDDPDKLEKEPHGKAASGSEKKEYNSSELDIVFEKVWNSLTDDQKHKIGVTYPNKFGKPQLNPQYFKKSEKEEILKKLKK